MAKRLAALAPADRRAVLAEFGPEDLEQLEYHWALWARGDQLPPTGTWRDWLLLGGRGSGKTRSAAEWVRSAAESGRRVRIALVGPTADTIRRDMVEGVSGILSISPPWCKPNYEPSSRRIVWPNGAIAYLFSAEEPDRLRGPNLDAYWADELTSWVSAEAVWANLQMALRLTGPKGDAPAGVISTTPKPGKLLKQILAAPTTAVTRSRTSDNHANLDPHTLAYLHTRYDGTTLGRQELDAELITDAEGALWSRAMLEACRRPFGPKSYSRIVVAVDPAGSSASGNAETGIVVVGLGPDKHGYVLEDVSGRYSPETWAKQAIASYHAHKADRIVAEKNFGGEMVESVIRAIDKNVPIKLVTASRGKAVRAEPVVALYEQQRMHHVGNFPTLEDQLCEWSPGGQAPSPDRLDALVWAVSDAVLGDNGYDATAPGLAGLLWSMSDWNRVI